MILCGIKHPEEIKMPKEGFVREDGKVYWRKRGERSLAHAREIQAVLRNKKRALSDFD